MAVMRMTAFVVVMDDDRIVEGVAQVVQGVDDVRLFVTMPLV